MGMAQVCHTWHISTAVVAAPGRARCVPLSVMGLLHELIGTPDPTPRRVALWGILSSCSNAFFFSSYFNATQSRSGFVFSTHGWVWSAPGHPSGAPLSSGRNSSPVLHPTPCWVAAVCPTIIEQFELEGILKGHLAQLPALNRHPQLHQCSEPRPA